MSEDLAEFRRRMIAKREFYGPKSTIGHLCSNAIEQKENLEAAKTNWKRTNLTNSHARTMQHLDSLDYLG